MGGKRRRSPRLLQKEDNNYDDETTEFEVDAVTARRFRGGAAEYRILWKGYPESESTWEPERNLEHCQAKVRAFLGELPRPTMRARIRVEKDGTRRPITWECGKIKTKGI